MADSFGLKIGLEGEKEFKKALADINQSFKVLGSEMKLATSQFDKNDKSVEALAARNNKRLIDLAVHGVRCGGIAGTFDGDRPLVILPAGRTPGAVFLLHA